MANENPFDAADDPNPFDTNTLSDARGSYAEELRSNPNLIGQLFSLTHREVGGQGIEAQQAFVETVFNRAAARGQSLEQAIGDRSYYPSISHVPASIPEQSVSDYSSILGDVANGSNISNGATGNASGNVGFAGGPQTFSAGGERFGIEGSDLGKSPAPFNPFDSDIVVSAKEIPGVSFATPAGPSRTPAPIPEVPLDVGLAAAPDEFPEASPTEIPPPDDSYMDLLAHKEGDKPLLTFTPEQIKLGFQIAAPNIARNFGMNPLTQNAYEGLNRSGARLLSGMTTPNNVIMLGTMAVAPELAGGQFIGRAASLGFSAATAKAVWDTLPFLGQDVGSSNWWANFGDLVFNAAMMGFGLHGTFRAGQPAGTPSGGGAPPVQYLGNLAAKNQLAALLAATSRVTDATVIPQTPVASVKPAGTRYKYRFLPKVPLIPAGKKLIQSPFQRWLGNRDAALQFSDFASMDLAKKIAKVVPRKDRRIAIYNWASAGGDEALLNTWTKQAPADIKKGYQDALSLNAHEKDIGKTIRDGFDQWLARAIDMGMLEEGVPNYLRRIVTKRPDIADDSFTGAFRTSSGLNPSFPAARQRFWETMVDAERNGVRYNKDIGTTTFSYARSFGHAAIDKAAIAQLFDSLTENGRPMLIVEGQGIRVGDPQNTALLVSPYGVRKFPGQAAEAKRLKQMHPNWSDEHANAIARDNIRKEYVSMDQLKVSIPALRNWTWIDTAPDGTQTLMRGNAMMHKSVANQLVKKFATDRIDWLDKFVKAQGQIKGAKLSMSLFHDVHERVNAAGHLVNSFGTRSLESLMTDPRIRYGMQNGLQMFGGRMDAALLGEGMAAQSWIEKTPGLGKWIGAYKNWLFEDMIPRYKGEMYLQAFERNKSRYPLLNDEQIAKLTARQANATFGEQNYRQMIGKLSGDPRFWQTLQGLFLAPDFGVSKLQHIGQAVTPYGGEQRMGIGTVAATLYTGARILNQILDNDPHMEKENMFAVVIGNRRYMLRSLPGDLEHLVTDTGSYAYHRMAPLIGPTVQAMFKHDYMGRPYALSDYSKDLMLSVVPIPVSGVAGGMVPWGRKSQYNAGDAVVQTLGASVSIYRDELEIRKLATEWKKQDPELVADIEARQGYANPPSIYADFRSALANDDLRSARFAYDELLARGGKMTENHIAQQMKKWSTAPWATGSPKLESQFLDSLTRRQHDRYDAATEERQKVYENYQKFMAEEVE